MISIIDSTGHERFLGNIPGKLKMRWTVYGDVPQTPMVPQSRWEEFCNPALEDDPFLPPTHDQDGVGECNCSATAGGMERNRNQEGLPYVHLSAADLYGRINGGSDNGSMLEDGLQVSMAEGVCTVDACGYLDWRKGANPSQQQLQERKKYRVLEAFLCPTFAHCMSAVIEGFSLISGILWYPNYDPDGDGWLPTYGAGSPGGHAVMGYAPAKRGNQYGIWHQNSWGARWGRKGRCVFPESAYGNSIGGWWAIRSTVTEDGDIPAPRS